MNADRERNIVIVTRMTIDWIFACLILTPLDVADAKARLSEVVEKARRDGPQIITKNGRSTAVLVSIEEWERKTARSWLPGRIPSGLAT